jgi:predicted  nucleic acid-binding Zn-ribbon protein
VSQRSARLLELQRLDAEIGRLERQLQQSSAALADRLQERAAEYGVKQAETTVHTRQLEQRDLEFELSRLETRIKEYEQRLYSGKGSPRDLQSLQRNIEHERERRDKLEEQALLAMEATEAAAKELARIKDTAGRVLGDAAARHRRLEGERAQLEAVLASTQASRRQLAGQIEAADLAHYDRLRQRVPDGIAVAPVIQGRCEGCRTTLPSAEVQRARRAEAVTFCSACSRILHVPAG